MQKLFSRQLIIRSKRFLCYSTQSTFKANDLSITLCEENKKRPKPSIESLRFGQTFTDHMLLIKWKKDDGWTKPIIKPIENFSIHPAAKVLHYSQELFEGTKAFRGDDQKIRLFRIEKNMERMLRGIERLNLPSFDSNELIECIKKLIEIDQDWVPFSTNASLYLRPTIFGCEPSLGVASSNEAILFVIMSPVGSYFNTSKKAVSLIADPKWVRAWPGGVGSYKFGSNYAPTIAIQYEAEKKGYHQILWLFGDNDQITEVGTMNILVYLINEKGEKELITPGLREGIILPGVIRDSLLHLAKEWNEFKISERPITMAEIVETLKDNRLKEIFGCGTACVVCPVENIFYKNINYKIPTMTSEDNINGRFLKELTDIQYGRKNYLNWNPIVC